VIRVAWIAAGLLALAAAPVSFSGASFTDVTVNPGSGAGAALLQHDNSKAGSAVLAPVGMKPGDTATGTVDLRNSGDVAARFSLRPEDLTDVPAAPALSARLQLRVEDAGTSAVVHDGTLAGLTTRDLGTWAAGETRSYRFTVRFPAVDEASDAPLQGARTSVRLVWESTT
jgi:hypothetical protein